MTDLTDAVALVTGASRGVGQHIARALAGEGCRVALLARTADPLHELAAERGMERSLPVVADITSSTGRTEALRLTEQGLGPIDILVNNAGLNRACAYSEFPEAELMRMVELNLFAPILLSRLVLPGMLARGRGHILNISSMSGLKGTPYSVTYSTTKFGLNGFSDALRHETRGSGVGVTAICPGFVSGEGGFARNSGHVANNLGSVTPEAVAAACVRAIKRDQARPVVASVQLKLGGMLSLLSPALGTRLAEFRGVRELYRRRVESDAHRVVE